MQPSILIDNLTVAYDRHPAIHHLTAALTFGSFTAVIGPNGSGKTTLLQTIAGLRAPNEGRVLLQGVSRRDIGYLPQQAQIDRSFPITVGDLVASGLWRTIGPFSRGKRQHMNIVGAALAKVGLTGFEPCMINTLSGGQFQRMLFARLIVQDLPVLLLDEPFNAIDEKTAAELLVLLDDWHDESRTILVVTHDIDLAMQRFPSTLLMARELIAHGDTCQVLTADNLHSARHMCGSFDRHAEQCLRGVA